MSLHLNSTKWKLILGAETDPSNKIHLDPRFVDIAQALDKLFHSESSKGLADSAPQLNKWLGDIRKYFDSTTVEILQKEAIEKFDLKELLFQPEVFNNLSPDIEIINTILQLQALVPDETRESARDFVKNSLEIIKQKLELNFYKVLQDHLDKKYTIRNPKVNAIDWKKTILINLKNYQKNIKAIIPDKVRGYSKKGKGINEITLCVDHSASMSTSIIYSSIYAAIIASIKSLKTNFITFDSSVVDLSEQLQDPVDLLFGTQLGGGTDITKAIGYCDQIIEQKNRSILILISDLDDNNESFLFKLLDLKKSGVILICLLALDDMGTPQFNKKAANILNQNNIPVFACTPDKFPDLFCSALKGEDLSKWAEV